MARKATKKLKEEVEKKGLKLSVIENGKCKRMASCDFLENKLRQYSNEGGVTMADSVFGRRLENKSQEVGSQKKSEKEEVQVEILAYQEYSLPEELHEGGCQQVVTSGHGASKNVGSACSGFGPHREIEIEETDGSCSGHKRAQPPCPYSWKHVASKWRKNFPPWPLSFWAEGVWTGEWHHQQREAWVRQIREVQMWRQVRGSGGAVMCETRYFGHQVAAFAYIDILRRQKR